MDFSKLTDGLGDELKNLGEEVVEGKTSWQDALSEEKDSLLGKAKGLFGGDDSEPAADDADDK